MRTLQGVTEKMQIINPYELKQEDLPLIVLTDDLRSFFNWATTAHTKGNYGHIMTMTEPGLYDSMLFSGYKRVPIKVYDKPSLIIKFWSVKCTPEQAAALLAAVKEYAARKWWQRRYDPLGIIGQLFNVRVLQSPLGEYCSELVGKHIRKHIDPAFPLRQSPSGLNRYMTTRPDIYTVKGYVYPED